MTDWGIHIEGLIQLVSSRGLRQTRTKLGRAIFREAREWIVSALYSSSISLAKFTSLQMP